MLPFFISPRLKLVLAAWLVGETIAFLVIVHLIGYAGAVLAGLLTSVLGFSMLKRAGASAMAKLRAGLGRSGRPGGPLLDDTLATIGAIAMLLPGFLSDIVGLGAGRSRHPQSCRSDDERSSARHARFDAAESRPVDDRSGTGGMAPYRCEPAAGVEDLTRSSAGRLGQDGALWRWWHHASRMPTLRDR